MRADASRNQHTVSLFRPAWIKQKGGAEYCLLKAGMTSALSNYSLFSLFHSLTNLEQFSVVYMSTIDTNSSLRPLESSVKSV